MKKLAGFLFLLSMAVVPVAQADTALSNVTGGSQGETYLGVGGGVDFPIQNAGTEHHGVLSLVSGRTVSPNLVGEGEFDGMAYEAGANGGLLDMRLFATAKLMPDTPFVQPYGLLGFGFAGLIGIDANSPNLLSMDFIWGGGFRVELAKRAYLFLDYKMHILVRDYPTGIDSPLTGGVLFPF